MNIVFGIAFGNEVTHAAAECQQVEELLQMLRGNCFQLALPDTGLFKGKERKAITAQIEQTEKEITEKLDALPKILKDDGYPDASAFMKTYRKAEALVEDYNRDLAKWERKVKEGKEPAKKEKSPESTSVRERLRQLQQQGKQQPHKKKSFDRDSR